MNNVLLVDDEPIIVDSLFNMLSRTEHLELNVWKATSAMEGIRIMQNHRIDILITDVRMPGISGLELVSQVRKQWARCKVIFLSGYSDYAYLQSALRHDAFDYLLKPADDEAILDTLKRVISEIDSEMQAYDVMAQAELQLNKAQNLLQKEFVEGLLKAQPLKPEQIAARIRELQIPLAPEQNMIMLIGRVDRWPGDSNTRENKLLQYAVNNIVEEYLQPICRIISFAENQYLVWFMQIEQLTFEENLNEAVFDLDKLQWYINELLEKIQQSIQDFLHLPVSFVLSKPNISWQQIQQTYKIMCELMQRGIGLDENIILVEQADEMLTKYQEQAILSQNVKRNMNQLLNLLESGNKAAFQSELTDFFRLVQKSIFLDYSLQLEIFAHISAMFLSYLNARNIKKTLGQAIEFEYLANYGKHANWLALENYFLTLSNQLLSLAEVERKDQKKEIVNKVDAFVVKNFQTNISLGQLAKQFHLSPFYLSRLYHIEMGVSLSERMKQLKITLAKELLAIEGMKIQQVALELGFENVPYFTKFFKKIVGITPQEFKQNNKI